MNMLEVLALLQTVPQGNKRRTTWDIPEDLVAKVQRIATRSGLSQANVVTCMLIWALSETEKAE